MPEPTPAQRAKAEWLYHEAVSERMTIETIARLIAERDEAQDAAAELRAGGQPVC